MFAVENGSQTACVVFLAADRACTGHATTWSPVYSAPGSAWWTHNVTVSATRTH
ncbi:hypothetical protein [Streptosporangium sp. LJ11]|uniref:hypothetical protein n=1 Tax=Streptosporangium sp. LJ11 TaxID=3436927 RepID=UPI003F78E746